MKDEEYRIFKAFADAFHESVSSMTGLSVKRISPEEVLENDDGDGVGFHMMTGFKGLVCGSFSLKSSAAAVMRLYEKYLGEKPESLDESVLDGVKELVSIVNGTASGKEQAMKLQFTPPLAFMSGRTNGFVSAKAVGFSVSFFVEHCGVFTVEIAQGKSA
jgi:CheY-specific phosphatase CheX